MPVTSAIAAQVPPAEQRTIDDLLAGIRRRLYVVRLTERLILALAWGGAVAVCLTGSRLLREGALRFDISRPGLGWCALLLALLPAVMVWPAFRKYQAIRRLKVNGVTTLTPPLILAALVITLLLSLAAVVLFYTSLGGKIPVWTVPVSAILPYVVAASVSVRIISPRAAAIFVDQQVGLHERVSTALEILQSPAQSSFEVAFRGPVIASAVGACQQVRDAMHSRTTRIGFHRLDQRAYALAALAAIAAAGVTFFQPLPAEAKSTRRATTITVNQARKLEEVMQDLQKAAPPNDKTVDKHLKPLEQAISQLKQGDMSPLEANAALSEAKEQMKKDQEAMQAADKVQQMLKDMQQTKELASASEDQKNAQVAEAQGQASATPQAGMNDLKNAAESLANKMKEGGMSEGDRKQLAENLEGAAKQAGADPKLQKDLQNAANAAKAGDSEKLSQSMQAAGDRMSQQRAEQEMSKQAMQKAMAEIDSMQGQSGGQSTMAQNNQDQPGGGNQPSPRDQGSGGQQDQSTAGGSQGKQPNDGGGPQNGDGQQANGGGQSGGGQGSQSEAAGQPGGGGSGQRQSADGSTMTESPGGPGGPENGPLGGKGSFVRIYDQQQTNTSGSTEKVGSKINPLGGAAKGSIDVKGPADKNDPAFKTYADVMEDAHQRAMDELTRQDIPPQYQDMVKAFYQEPGKGDGGKK